MAFGYSAASSSNGHFVILETQPQLLDYGTLSGYLPSQSSTNLNSLLSRFNVYAVPVYDCSGLQAHFRDSRTQMSGIGHGTLIMLTDPVDDAPMGYVFDTLQAEGNTLNYDSLGEHVYAISVGRFVTTPANSLQQVNPDQSLMIYPNPTQGLINIKLSSAPDGATATLYNLLGQKINSWQLGPVPANGICTLNLGVIAVGTYLLHVSDSAGNGMYRDNVFICSKR